MYWSLACLFLNGVLFLGLLVGVGVDMTWDWYWYLCLGSGPKENSGIQTVFWMRFYTKRMFEQFLAYQGTNGDITQEKTKGISPRRKPIGILTTHKKLGTSPKQTLQATRPEHDLSFFAALPHVAYSTTNYC